MFKKVGFWINVIGIIILLPSVFYENVLFKTLGLSILIIGSLLQLYGSKNVPRNPDNNFKIYDSITGELRMRDIPGEVSDAIISRLCVKDGDVVNKDDLLSEVETNKVILEVVSPISSRIKTLKVSLGQKIIPGEVLMELYPEGAE